MTAAALGQIGEGHAPSGQARGQAIVGQHGVDGIGESADNATEEVRSVYLACILLELDVKWNLDTRSMAKDMLSLPWARRSSLMSMWT